MKNKIEELKQQINEIFANLEVIWVGQSGIIPEIEIDYTKTVKEKLYQLINKHTEQIKKEVVEDFVNYMSPWLEKSFRNIEFRQEVVKQYLEKGQNEHRK